MYSILGPLDGLRVIATMYVIFAADSGVTYGHTEELETGWRYL